MNSSDESDSDDIEYYKLMNRALKNQINQLEQTLANQNQDSLIKKNQKRFEYINQNCYIENLESPNITERIDSNFAEYSTKS